MTPIYTASFEKGMDISNRAIRLKNQPKPYKMVTIYAMASIILLGHAAFAQKKNSYTNRSYEPQIKTIQLYNHQLTGTPQLQAAVGVLSQQPSLRLEFDDLTNQADDYSAKLIYCDYNWKPSQLSDLDFIEVYNEFEINNYTFSTGSGTPYVHYQFNIPTVKLPGNYVVIVYRNGDTEDIVLSHRFMIYSNHAQIIN